MSDAKIERTPAKAETFTVTTQTEIAGIGDDYNHRYSLRELHQAWSDALDAGAPFDANVLGLQPVQLYHDKDEGTEITDAGRPHHPGTEQYETRKKAEHDKKVAEYEARYPKSRRILELRLSWTGGLNA